MHYYVSQYWYLFLLVGCFLYVLLRLAMEIKFQLGFTRKQSVFTYTNLETGTSLITFGTEVTKSITTVDCNSNLELGSQWEVRGIHPKLILVSKSIGPIKSGNAMVEAGANGLHLPALVATHEKTVQA